MIKVTCSDLSAAYGTYANKMNAGYRDGWDNHKFASFDLAHEWQEEDAELPEGCTPTVPMYDMPSGYSMYTWDKPSGRVIGKYIIVSSDPSVRPFVEAHELGHAWNMVEGGYGKSVDELQACLRGARYIPYLMRPAYWGHMWAYMRVIGAQHTWGGYVFNAPPDQIGALQFAWSVANGYFLYATPLAQPIK